VVGLGYLNVCRSCDGRRGLDDEVLQRPGQQGDTRPNPKRQCNFQRQRSGHKHNRENASDENEGSALGIAVEMLLGDHILSDSVDFGLFIRNGAVRQILFTQLGTERNIRRCKVSR
jgi:hypothetical protein